MSGVAWLVAVGVALGAPVDATEHSLPLRRGVYVEVSTGCPQAPSAARAWFGGGYAIQHPHADCEVRSVTRRSPARYVVAERCFEYGDKALPFDVVNRIRVQSRTEFRLDNRFGRFHARWCRG